MSNAQEPLFTLFSELSLLQKMFDANRFVDPLSNEVLSLTDVGNLEKNVDHCFQIWSQSSTCENCISFRAYREQQIHVKMQFEAGRIFLVWAVPVTIDNRQLVLELLKDITSSMFVGEASTGEDASVVKMIQELNMLTVKDELTRLFNRRYISDRLPAEIRTAGLQNKPVSVIMADLDYFKTVNDRYGHQVGDHVLQRFARILNQEIRSGLDWAARYGGEEFLICLPQADLAAAKKVAERIRRKMEQAKFMAERETFTVTCSLGICTADAADDSLAESIIACADYNLYEAKASGRNRVVPGTLASYQQNHRPKKRNLLKLKQTGSDTV